MILMWSCPGNMPKYYPGLRHITLPFGRVICLSDLGNILAYYLDKTTLLYNYHTIILLPCKRGNFYNCNTITLLPCKRNNIYNCKLSHNNIITL